MCIKLLPISTASLFIFAILLSSTFYHYSQGFLARHRSFANASWKAMVARSSSCESKNKSKSKSSSKSNVILSSEDEHQIDRSTVSNNYRPNLVDIIERYCGAQLEMRIDPNKNAALRERLLRWYRENRRSLPWRGDDPELQVTAYGTWVSEVMLQQTRVETVIDYYYRCILLFRSLSFLFFILRSYAFSYNKIIDG